MLSSLRLRSGQGDCARGLSRMRKPACVAESCLYVEHNCAHAVGICHTLRGWRTTTTPNLATSLR